MPNAPGPLKDFAVITEDGITHPLYSGNVHFVYLDGVGLPLITRLLDKSPLQHGAVDRGYRIEPRVMTLHLAIDGDADNQRDRLAGIFSPTDEPLTLKCTRDDLQIRYIDCFTQGALDFPMSSRVGDLQQVDIELVAPNPAFYDASLVTDTASLTDSTVNVDLDTTGITFQDWPVIDITGPVASGSSFIHYPGTQQITLASAIPSGETFRFDFREGHKTVVRLSDSANRLSYVNPTYISSFSDFQIVPPKRATAIDPSYSTTNRYAFTCTGTSGASEANIYWYKRYISL